MGVVYMGKKLKRKAYMMLITEELTMLDRKIDRAIRNRERD